MISRRNSRFSSEISVFFHHVFVAAYSLVMEPEWSGEGRDKNKGRCAHGVDSRLSKIKRRPGDAVFMTVSVLWFGQDGTDSKVSKQPPKTKYAMLSFQSNTNEHSGKSIESYKYSCSLSN